MKRSHDESVQPRPEGANFKGVTVVPDQKLSGNILPQQEPEIHVVSLGECRDMQKLNKYVDGQVRCCSQTGLQSLVKRYDEATDGTGMVLEELLTLGVKCIREESILQRGAFGQVTKCTDLEKKHEFALKKTKKEKFNQREVKIPAHKNVCQMLGMIIQKDEIWLLLEWAGVALDKYPVHELSCHQIWNLAIQGFEALTHLAQYSLRHMDIKPGNICVKSAHLGLTLILIDFGTAKIIEEISPRSGYTMFYMSPELYKYTYKYKYEDLSSRDQVYNRELTGKIDVYQFTLVLLSILSKGSSVMRQMAKERLSGLKCIKTEFIYMEMMCHEKDLGEKVVDRVFQKCLKEVVGGKNLWCHEDFELMKPLFLKCLTHFPKDRLEARDALKEAKKLQGKLPSLVIPVESLSTSSMSDETKPPDKRAKIESEEDTHVEFKLPDLRSLYDEKRNQNVCVDQGLGD